MQFQQNKPRKQARANKNDEEEKQKEPGVLNGQGGSTIVSAHRGVQSALIETEGILKPSGELCVAGLAGQGYVTHSRRPDQRRPEKRTKEAEEARKAPGCSTEVSALGGVHSALTDAEGTLKPPGEPSAADLAGQRDEPHLRCLGQRNRREGNNTHPKEAQEAQGRSAKAPRRASEETVRSRALSRREDEEREQRKRQARWAEMSKIERKGPQ